MTTRHPTTISASCVRTQLGALLDQVAQRGARVLITRRGRPVAILHGVSDVDDLTEARDEVFQKSLAGAAEDIRAGEGVTRRAPGTPGIEPKLRNVPWTPRPITPAELKAIARGEAAIRRGDYGHALAC